MIKQSKTKLTLMFTGILVAGVMMTACNNSAESEKAEKKDTVTTPAPAPAAKPDTGAANNGGDTTTIKGDTKPTPEKP